MWRHQIGVVTPLRPLQVATSKRGRDTVSPAQPPSQVVTSFFQVATSWSFTYVATSFPCRDLVLAHSGTSRSRHRNPCRDLPHCRLCHDSVSSQPKQTRSRLHFLVETSCPTELGPTQPSLVATPISGRDLKLLLKASSMSQPQNPSCNPLKPKPGRDLTSMSRLQITQPMSRHEIHVTTKANQSQPQPNQVATSNLGRDPTLEFGSSHSSFCLAPIIFFIFQNHPVAFLPATPLMQ